VAVFPTPFGVLDALRRGQGVAADRAGVGPEETEWREAAAWPGARLRAYGGGEGPPLLIVPAPFKRAYIWDLTPSVSVVQAAMRAGFRVHLLEWLPAGGDGAAEALGLEDFALRLPEAALDAVAAETGADRAALLGHSLGGTLALLLAALRPDRVAGLGLVDAPVAFGRDGGPLAAAAAAAPPARTVAALVGDPVPGAAINFFSAQAAPEAFLRQPAADRLATATLPEERAIHDRVRRWTLDEFPMPRRLFEAVAEELYRGDRLRLGGLILAGERVDLGAVVAPVAAVVNPAGLIVPPQSMFEGLRRMRPRERLVVRYRAEPGSLLQHLGPLVGRGAHRRLWPQLLPWLAGAAG
jgi:polyhydroxyalkanoate synthase subunit PhaC